MRKTKVIALVLCAAVALMGAGYAYWTDTLTINNTISTGELNVRFTTKSQNYTRGGDDQTGELAAGKPKAYFASYVRHEGLNNGPETIISEDGKAITTQVTNLYPGAYAQYYGMLENTGTIPASFDYAEVTFEGRNGEILTEGEEALKNNLNFAFGYIIKNADGTDVNPNPNSGDKRHYASGNMSQFQEKLNALLTGISLEPGQKMSLDMPNEEAARAAMAEIDYPYNSEMKCITYTFKKTAGDETENQQLNIKIKLNWKQHNAPATSLDTPR